MIQYMGPERDKRRYYFIHNDLQKVNILNNDEIEAARDLSLKIGQTIHTLILDQRVRVIFLRKTDKFSLSA